MSWRGVSAAIRSRCNIFVRLQLSHLSDRFGSRLLNIAAVPAAFVRPRDDGQPLVAMPELDEEGIVEADPDDV